MMFALALLDLPFEASEHKTELQGNELILTVGSPAIVFHEQINQVQGSDTSDASVLVNQNFFKLNDRYRAVQGQRQDKFVVGEFLVNTVYGCQIVVTNATSSTQSVDILLQLPEGSLPTLKSKETRSVHLDLKPFHTQTVEYHLYFPTAGDFSHFPVHFSREEQFLASAAPVPFHVVNNPSQIDGQSWEYVSQFGSNTDVLEFLNLQNVHAVKLNRITLRIYFPTTTDSS